jgi:hypothetical protein
MSPSSTVVGIEQGDIAISPVPDWVLGGLGLRIHVGEGAAMSVAVVRAWDRRSIVGGRRLPARYPITVAAIVVAVVVAACAGNDSRQQALTLETVRYQAPPAALTGVKLPIGSGGVVAVAARLPERVAGQGRLPYGGWLRGDQFVAGWGDTTAWGTPHGQTGTPPIQITIRHVDSLGQQAATSGGTAVIADANHATNMAGRLEVGRDGAVVWLRRADAGYTVAWGRLDSPWLYVVTASSEREAEAALLAFAGTAGRHGGGHSVLR